MSKSQCSDRDTLTFLTRSIENREGCEYGRRRAAILEHGQTKALTMTGYISPVLPQICSLTVLQVVEDFSHRRIGYTGQFPFSLLLRELQSDCRADSASTVLRTAPPRHTPTHPATPFPPSVCRVRTPLAVARSPRGPLLVVVAHVSVVVVDRRRSPSRRLPPTSTAHSLPSPADSGM